MKIRSLLRLVSGALLLGGAAEAQTLCGAWSHSPTPSPGGLNSRFLGVAAISAADVWAVGDSDSLAGSMSSHPSALTARWNGASWSMIPTPAVGVSGTTLTGVAGIAADDVWAVGYSSTYGMPQTLVQRWNGSQWSVVPSPVISGGSLLDAVAAVSANDIWAVGSRAGGLPEFAATRVTLTVHWDGAAWSAVPSPNVSNRSHELLAVAAVSSDDVWAVGSSRDIGELYRNLILHWDGDGWTVVPAPQAAGAENELHAVAAIASDDVWALGRTNDGVAERAAFLHWDGSAWSTVPAPPGGEAPGYGALVAFSSGDVWAVGGRMAHWDGSNWSLAPEAVVPGAAGISLVGASKAGACDAWAVGLTFDLDARRTLAVHLEASGETVPLDVPSGATQGSLKLAAGPNPFEGTARIHFELPAPARVTVRVLDAAGRLVRDVLRADLPAGGHEALWDGRDLRGLPAPPGAYYVHVAAGAERRTVSLSRLR